MLSIYLTAPSAVVRSALGEVLEEILSKSILFRNRSSELPCWFFALPTNSRIPGTESPDGALLTDEKESVLEFLDDCIQRCLKTPYRYIEALNSLMVSEDEVDDSGKTDDLDTPIHESRSLSITFSPLLATVIEQLRLKSSSNKAMFSPSDCLAVVTFTRKLLYSLSLNTHHFSGIRSITCHLSNDLPLGEKILQRPIIAAAIRREANLANSLLCNFLPPSRNTPSSSQLVIAFLNQIESLPQRTHFHLNNLFKRYNKTCSQMKHLILCEAQRTS
jgi:nucleolar pre-ribosomal-associated protein 1